MLAHKLMGGSAADKLYVDDVFSTYLYAGNSSTQTITNGIDLAGEGGLVWIKVRNTSSVSHSLWDTNQGRTKRLNSASTGASFTDNVALPSFNINGFSLNGSTTTTTNGSGNTYASWTFRKAPKFFDVVTKSHTNGVASTVDLSTLGTVGMVVVKATSTTSNWYTWHRSLTAGNNLKLNLTDAQSTTNAYLSVSGTTLTIASTAPTATYIVYAFAHDTAADGMIQCGSFTTDASGNATVNLGWEPQFLLTKTTSTSGQWFMLDVMRGWSKTGRVYLAPESASAEATLGGDNAPFATGFTAGGIAGSATCIYLAIRRPNKPPTSGTGVYNAIARTGTGAAATVTGVGFAPDLVMSKNRSAAVGNALFDRLRGAALQLNTSNTGNEIAASLGLTGFEQDGYSVGADGSEWTINKTGDPYINHFFRRAPGFFDVVCYTGTGVARTVPHNLGVTPELMIVKSRTGDVNWFVYDVFSGPLKVLRLNTTDTPINGSILGPNEPWNNTAPTNSSFSVCSVAAVNASGATYVAYLFASLPGISKVGSYTGNGSSQTINCGFSAGARFILIKRTDSTGDWYVWDSARGIVAANDPHLSLNTTAAEVTTDDSVDPDSTGFIVNQNATTNINVTSASYIFLAIA